MNVVVCAKQVPDPEVASSYDPDDFTLVRDHLVLDDADTYGVELALQLRDAAGEGEVVLLSMAPGGDTGALRPALAMGADRAVQVSDEALAGTDALGTAKVLAAALRRLRFDLVICATESTDGYTGTVPVQLAELLSLPSVSCARSVAARDDVLRVERQSATGTTKIDCPLPAVVSVTAGVVEPRYPSLRGIMGARAKPVEVVDLDGLGLESEVVGLTGARQRVTALDAVPARAGGELVHDEGAAHERVLAFLAALGLA